jgi:hypothetical protein
MRCIQDTTLATWRFTALEWNGLASDSALEALPPVIGRRLRIAAGEQRRCCGASIDLVAVDPDDPALPVPIQLAVRDLAPGHAIAATDLAELAGGWIAAPGVDIRITGRADLGAGVVAITLADAAALLTSEGAHRLLVRTIAVLTRAPAAVPVGWRVVAEDAESLPLASGPTAVHRQGCPV